LFSFQGARAEVYGIPRKLNNGMTIPAIGFGCYNAKGGVFNIMKDSEISGMKIGASKWWVEYIEEPEDLTLETISGAKTWDFSNARYFSSDFTKSKVRDQLLFNVSSNKITVENGIIGFTAATVGNKKGVPQDGFLAFQVDQPGSVIVKPVDDNNTTNHIIVGVGPTSGTSVTVKGGASALTDMQTSSNRTQHLLSTATSHSQCSSRALSVRLTEQRLLKFQAPASQQAAHSLWVTQ